jgi:hypothetical protein
LQGATGNALDMQMAVDVGAPELSGSLKNTIRNRKQNDSSSSIPLSLASKNNFILSAIKITESAEEV